MQTEAVPTAADADIRGRRAQAKRQLSKHDGLALRIARMRRRISVEAIAAERGVSKQRIYQWESSRRQLSRDVAEKYLLALWRLTGHTGESNELTADRP